MKWSVHPAKENHIKTGVSLLFIIGFLTYVSVFFGVLFGIVGLIILTVSLHSYYFPTQYELTDNEIIITKFFGTQRRQLSEFRKVYEGKNGLLLSPFSRKTFLNQFRGVFLLLPHERNAIVEYVKKRVVDQQKSANKTPGKHETRKQ